MVAHAWRTGNIQATASAQTGAMQVAAILMATHTEIGAKPLRDAKKDGGTIAQHHQLHPGQLRGASARKIGEEEEYHHPAQVIATTQVIGKVETGAKQNQGATGGMITASQKVISQGDSGPAFFRCN